MDHNIKGCIEQRLNENQFEYCHTLNDVVACLARRRIYCKESIVSSQEKGILEVVSIRPGTAMTVSESYVSFNEIVSYIQVGARKPANVVFVVQR